MSLLLKVPNSVARSLEYYVYLYVNPETEQVFYVGKGRGNRALSHCSGRGMTPHDEVIRDLKKKNLEPRVEILIHGLKDEATALAVEMAAIDLLGLQKLTNCVSGHHSSRRGRMTLEQIRALYERKEVKIAEPALLIRISRAYRYGMGAVELYDATRSAWRIGPRCDKAEFAFAVYDGIVREVYQITAWLPSGSTLKSDRLQGDPIKDRQEFVGVLAEEAIRRKYVNHSVSHYFAKQSRNPILYLNC